MRSVAHTPQAMRKCRWCQPQLRAAPHADGDMLDVPWECVRITGEERPVTEAECAGCAGWQPESFVLRRRVSGDAGRGAQGNDTSRGRARFSKRVLQQIVETRGTDDTSAN
jgi:hypothetical protein